MRLNWRGSVSSPPQFGHFFAAMRGRVDLVGAETRFAFLAVDERVDEAGDVARGFPDARVHEDRGVDAFDVLAIGHRAPPALLDVALELDAERAVVPAGVDAAVNLAGRKDEAAALAQRDQIRHVFKILRGTGGFCGGGVIGSRLLGHGSMELSGSCNLSKNRVSADG